MSGTATCRFAKAQVLVKTDRVVANKQGKVCLLTISRRAIDITVKIMCVNEFATNII